MRRRVTAAHVPWLVGAFALLVLLVAPAVVDRYWVRVMREAARGKLQYPTPPWSAR